MAGALETILEMTVEYAQQRVQFGRPIGKFQAVGQQIAVLAGEVAAAGRAADDAVAAAGCGEAPRAIAIAKARVGEAAGKCAEISHQVHGAIGFSYEYALHRFTRRLWSWRDEFGPESYWQAELGRSVAQRGADNLWAFLSEG
jgi:acyl-CoA dehydrogenase